MSEDVQPYLTNDKNADDCSGGTQGEQQKQSPAPKQAKTEASAGVGWNAMLAAILAVSVAVSSVTTFFYHHYFVPQPKQIVAVDILGYMATQKEDYVAGRINDTELERRFEALENLVVSFGEGVVVLSADSVLHGVEVLKP
ncbi:hypothetical protein [Geoalkalibacter halelectricus]|uniref:hypothetical protein n=1 Tax=Geoalkalibacter halelectricus TaxID=2847045 RepID=UPI00266EAB9D|nr:hypothetical protein [Geoalkalibacter halelectricus]MDO3380346.1 hypothetical protein [Geoalkalibacter halelectricus]